MSVEDPTVFKAIDQNGFGEGLHCKVLSEMPKLKSLCVRVKAIFGDGCVFSCKVQQKDGSKKAELICVSKKNYETFLKDNADLIRRYNLPSELSMKAIKSLGIADANATTIEAARIFGAKMEKELQKADDSEEEYSDLKESSEAIHARLEVNVLVPIIMSDLLSKIQFDPVPPSSSNESRQSIQKQNLYVLIERMREDIKDFSAVLGTDNGNVTRYGNFAEICSILGLAVDESKKLLKDMGFEKLPKKQEVFTKSVVDPLKLISTKSDTDVKETDRDLAAHKVLQVLYRMATQGYTRI